MHTDRFYEEKQKSNYCCQVQGSFESKEDERGEKNHWSELFE